MAETRRRFGREFREGAVRIVRETGKPIGHPLRVKVKPYPDQAATMPDGAERTVQRRVDFHLGNDGGLDRDERQRVPLGEVASPGSR